MAASPKSASGVLRARRELIARGIAIALAEHADPAPLIDPRERTGGTKSKSKDEDLR